MLRQLGVGGMGVVYEAEDRDRGSRVALKTLSALRPELIYRLKREFRVLADIEHPNLVAFHDLIVSDDACIFTMDLVDGVQLLDYVREGGEVDIARLRPALAQLASGLAALHATGTVHRDIKPDNILVRSDGSLVIVDFGLSVVGNADGEPIPSSYVAGTAAYMAPEQVDQAPVTPAADWYAVGVVLFEALTGRVPFEGPPLDVLLQKQARSAPAPRSLVPSTPPDLDTLCSELLARQPANRPTSHAVLRRLGAPAGSAPITLDGSSAFAGRDREMAVLARAIARAGTAATIVTVVGESGIGKSALVRQAVARARAAHPDSVVLRGRCFENELVPYNAMDALVDDLSRMWSKLPGAEAEELLPDDPGLLPMLFPVLGRVPAIADLTPRPWLGEPADARSQAFGAMREVMGLLAARSPVVVCLDDMQWVDADTLTLLADLLRVPSPPLCAILSARPSGADALADLCARAGVTPERVELGPIDAEAALSVAGALLGPEAVELAPHVARESGGSPFFLGELARYVVDSGTRDIAGLALGTVLRRRMDSLTGPARHVLDLLAVARKPVSTAVLGAAAELPATELVGVVRTLRLRNYARGAGHSPADFVEPYHDKVRELAYDEISPGRRQVLHRRLALGLEQAGEGTPDRLARHWRGAGQGERAAVHARRAGEQALAKLDSERAARLFRMALDLGSFSPGETLSLLRSIGDSLTQAGRPVEAADAYLAAAAQAEPDGASTLRRRAADVLLGGGYLEEGLQVIEPVLREFGVRLPAASGRAAVSLVWRRALLRARGYRYKLRPASEIRPRDLERVDLLRAVATGMNLSDYIRGADAQSRHIRAALACGEPTRIARALGYEAAHLAAVGASARARKVAALCAELATSHNTPTARGYRHFSTAVVDYYCSNEWRASLAGLQRAMPEFRSEQRAGWELDMTHAIVSFNHLYLGNLRELTALVHELIEDAVRRGARYDAVNMRTRQNLVWLVADDVDAARAQLERAMDAEMPSSDRYLAQHFFALHGAVELALYRGDVAEAEEVFAAGYDYARRSLVVRIRLVAHELEFLRARVALAAKPVESARLELAEGIARRLARQPEPVAGCFAAMIRAAVARARGDDRAPELIAAACECLGAADMALMVAVARMRAGDPAGRAWMEAEGVRNPDRMAAMILPWPSPA